MAAKKKGSHKKKIVRHNEIKDSSKTSGKDPEHATESESEKPRIAERIREKDSGFGVLKAVAVVIIGLIVGSMILFNRAGGQQSARGDKAPGQSCNETAECERGTICYSYKGRKRRCMSTCTKDKSCEPGYTCVSATTQKRRKGFRVTDICVEDADL